MKRFIFFARVYLWFAFTYPIALCAQDAQPSFPSYVVIGAFAYEQNAVHFTDEARRNKFPAVFEMNPNRNLYYVYVLSTTDKDYAVAEALKLRAETKYFDTWVYSGVLGKMKLAALQQAEDEDFDPVTGQKIARINPEEGQTSTEKRLPGGARTAGQQGDQQSSGNDPSGNEIPAKDQLADDPDLQEYPSANNSKNAATSTQRKDGQSANNLSSSRRSAERGEGTASETTDGSALTQHSNSSLQNNNAKPGSLKAGAPAQKTSNKSASPESQQTELQAQGQQNGKQTSAAQSNPAQNVNGQQTSLTRKTSLQRPQSSTPQGEGTGQMRSDDPEAEAQRNEGTTVAGQQGQLSGTSTPSSDAQPTGAQDNSAKQNATTGKTGSQKHTVVAGSESLSNSRKTAVADDQKAKSSVQQSQRPAQAQKENDAHGDIGDGDKTDAASKQDQLAGKSNALPVQSTGLKNSSTEQSSTTANAGSEKKTVTAGKENLSSSSEKTALATEETPASIPAPVRQTTAPLSSEEVVGKNFYFHLFRVDNLNTVPGEVEAIDFERSRKMATYPANEGVKVMMPSGKTKRISFVCQVFGYRKQQQEFDPVTPSEDLYLDDKGNLVVPFELIRLQKGDIAIMYNVFFFKDAAVMRPESRYEVNNLLELLQENPSYKIMIHGHTNGNASGKIIRMDKAGNFYSLSGTKQGFGSAKTLSEERALLIRKFLISSGISADRMNVKAWGGKKPIHDKHSNRAHENVRVEIEILSE